jgi:hypothetical protein
LKPTEKKIKKFLLMPGPVGAHQTKVDFDGEGKRLSTIGRRASFYSGKSLGTEHPNHRLFLNLS